MLRIGAKVQWYNDGKYLTGVVVRIVPAWTLPDPDLFFRVPRTKRDHISYVVRSGNGRAYWPGVTRMKVLEL